MMFVLGESKDSLDETSLLIEEICRRQMTEIACAFVVLLCVNGMGESNTPANTTQIARSLLQAHKRGSRFIIAEDLIFLIRHNQEKVNRLRIFLSWKDVRKNVKEKEVAPVFDETLDESIGASLSAKQTCFSLQIPTQKTQ